MTPITNGNPMADLSSPSLSSSINSLGAPNPAPEEKPNPVASQASDLINRVGLINQDIKNLQSSTPGAETEFNDLMSALKNWIAAKSDAIARSGGEPATY